MASQLYIMQIFYPYIKRNYMQNRAARTTTAQNQHRTEDTRSHTTLIIIGAIAFDGTCALGRRCRTVRRRAKRKHVENEATKIYIISATIIFLYNFVYISINNPCCESVVMSVCVFERVCVLFLFSFRSHFNECALNIGLSCSCRRSNRFFFCCELLMKMICKQMHLLWIGHDRWS